MVHRGGDTAIAEEVSVSGLRVNPPNRRGLLSTMSLKEVGPSLGIEGPEGALRFPVFF